MDCPVKVEVPKTSVFLSHGVTALKTLNRKETFLLSNNYRTGSSICMCLSGMESGDGDSIDHVQKWLSLPKPIYLHFSDFGGTNETFERSFLSSSNLEIRCEAIWSLRPFVTYILTHVRHIVGHT